MFKKLLAYFKEYLRKRARLKEIKAKSPFIYH